MVKTTRRAAFEVRTQALLPAPPERVWERLTAFAEYPDWNPTTPRLEVAAPELGARGRVQVRLWGLRFWVPIEIVTWDPPHRLAWLGAPPGLQAAMHGIHYFELEPHGEEGTRLHHGERFYGWLSPLGRWFVEGPLTRGYQAVNAALARTL